MVVCVFHCLLAMYLVTRQDNNAVDVPLRPKELRTAVPEPSGEIRQDAAHCQGHLQTRLDLI